MLKINGIKLEINTSEGLYGLNIPFKKGLNIIRGNNTTGKSTIFQSILYALGFEEILGAKNEKTMQSVLKDEVLDNNTKHKVLQSFVLLEIENKEIITIKRSVINDKRKSILIDVYLGPMLTKPEGVYELKQMYVHDRGSASDQEFGFHAYLEEFLGWDLPEVLNTQGDYTKLYLPLIAPAFIIEQKSGWTDFFATIPYYNVKNAEARVVEFILNLDVFKNELRKQEINSDKRILQEKWNSLLNEFKRLADKSSSEIIGLTEYPSIINNYGDVYFRIYRNNKSYLVTELIQELNAEHQNLVAETTSTVGKDVEKNQNKLNTISLNLNRYSLWHEQLSTEVFQEKEKLKQYILQKKNVEEDLKNNKTALKMYKIGADLPTNLAQQNCPTCGQGINDSLLPKEVEQNPMQIEENISFLDAQKKMIEIFVEAQRKRIIEKETLISSYQSQITTLRAQVRSIKKDLVSDDRLPSEFQIEQKIILKRQIEFYENSMDEIDSLKSRLKALSKNWEKILGLEKSLPKDFFSGLDREKITYMQNYFLSLLDKFNYNSKERDVITISYEKYLPVIEMVLPNEKAKTYDIRYDSFGSDLIRCLWAYYTSLLKSSNNYNGCHPGLMIFDEPQQQSASTNDFHEFLKELSSFKESQVIIFASFQNSDEDFETATQGVDYNLVKSDGKFVKLLD